MSSLRLDMIEGPIWELHCKNPPNDLSKNLRAKVTFGLSESVYAAEVNLTSGHTGRVVVKVARSPQEIGALKQESMCYTSLEALQGTHIPRCFGYFKGYTKDRNAVRVSCLLLELCLQDRHSPVALPLDQYNRWLMQGISRMHQAGILHGRLQEDAGHIIVDAKGYPRIIGFSGASRHVCYGMFKMTVQGNTPAVSSCPELVKMEVQRGIQIGSSRIFWDQAQMLALNGYTTNLWPSATYGGR